MGWGNWFHGVRVALGTLNPAIRVRIPVEPRVGETQLVTIIVIDYRSTRGSKKLNFLVIDKKEKKIKLKNHNILF